jgi:hypothetical protein
VFTAPTAPIAAEQLTDAILEAVGAGDVARATLLMQQLPKRPDGRLKAGDFIKVTAAGVAVPAANRPLGLEKLSAAEAQKALVLGRSGEGRGPTTNELILRGLGQPTGNADLDTLDPATAQAAAQIGFAARQKEQDNMLATIAAISGNPRLAEAFKRDQLNVEELFDRHNAPAVGGQGGQAAGPQVPGGAPTAPAQAGTPEPTAPVLIDAQDVSTLTLEQATAFATEVNDGRRTVTPEQREALAQRLDELDKEAR